MLKYIFACLLGFIVTLPTFGQRIELVWSDEFDGTTINPGVWVASFSTALNNELQFYTNRPENLRVRDGKLQIIGLRESYQNRSWTSARIRTQNRMDFKYGKVELRAKLPRGKGLWPAFWMLPSNKIYGGWPYSGEIDILENRGHEMDRFQTSLHFSAVASPGSGNTLADRRIISDETILIGDSLNTWHLYGLEWNEDGMIWYFDHEEVFRVSRTQIEAQAEVYPFDEEFHFILNLAIGGNYLGDQQPDQTTPDSSYFEVDYIRLYQNVNQDPEITLEPKLSNSDSLYVSSGATEIFTIQVSDLDGEVDSVEVFIGERKLSTFREPPYQTVWEAEIDGCYPFRVRATDNDKGITEITSATTIVVGQGCDKKPFRETKPVLPGTLNLVDFDFGGQDLSYYDLTPYKNSGGEYRPFDAVDIIKNPIDQDKYVLADLQDGEWLEYMIKVAHAGTYDLTLRSINENASGRVDLYLNNEFIQTFSRLSGDCGTGFEGYRCKTKEGIELTEGESTLRVVIVSNPGYLDALLFTLSNATTTIESQDNNVLPSRGFQLSSVYPNPFNPSTRLSFYLSESSSVSVKIVDVMGRIVKEWSPVRYSKGNHSMEIAVNDLSTGTYYLNVRTNTGSQTVPISYIR